MFKFFCRRSHMRASFFVGLVAFLITLFWGTYNIMKTCSHGVNFILFGGVEKKQFHKCFLGFVFTVILWVDAIKVIPYNYLPLWGTLKKKKYLDCHILKGLVFHTNQTWLFAHVYLHCLWDRMNKNRNSSIYFKLFCYSIYLAG